MASLLCLQLRRTCGCASTVQRRLVRYSSSVVHGSSLTSEALRRFKQESYGNNKDVNEVGIQQLAKEMRDKVFGSEQTIKSFGRNIELAQQHLAYHGLLGRKTNLAEPVVFKVPELRGSNLDEHFYKLGKEMSEPYYTNALNFANGTIPRVPKQHEWVMRSGWTKYIPGQEPFSVEFPDESTIVFDTEVLYKVSDFAVLAAAASPTAWYSWVSPWILGDTEDPRQLIPLNKRGSNNLVIGHHVGYDRKRVKEEYHIEESNSFYLDTMSLHIAVSGMCSRQRPDWMKANKKRKELKSQETSDSLQEIITEMPVMEDHVTEEIRDLQEELAENPWLDRSSMNNLADVASLHCGIKLDKSARDLFAEMSREQVVEKFNFLMNYCASDVDITYKVYQKVLPLFVSVCPHPVSFAALKNLASVFLPINQKWNNYVESAENCFQDANNEIYNRLKDLAQQASQLKDSPEIYEKDPWLCQLDWTIKPVRMIKDKNGDPVRPHKNQKLPGMPNWYKELFPTAASPMNVSVRSRISPILLRLEWDGHHFIWTDSHGWCFRVPAEKKDEYLKQNYALCDMNKESIKFKDDSNGVYFKIPHKDGASARCTVPMAKSYISYFEKGTLTSEYDYAKKAIQLNSQCAYWISARERIHSQMPVWSSDTEMGINVTSGKEFGMILPRIITMGTITRRAVEDAWLTASNAKKTRIGSEQKAMVQAPPGYKFVGADVDSEELWIASLLGDALFGIHGGSALGWMTLEGSKGEGTDLHSRTAQILGISRNNAKIFNYGRIYGAGIKFATQLLKQFNPLVTDEQSSGSAKKLFDATKGVRTRLSGFETKQFWRGGTESVVFNRLEEMAEQDLPRTPVLGATITEALKKGNLGKSNFLTSRVNWTIQSSGVDYLHLLIVSMNYLIRRYDIKARLAITIHDEIRYLVKEEDRYRAALALQISNLWTRAMFCQQLGIDNVPQSCAFFSLIDIDHVLRKEVDLDCVTPSHPTAIPSGEAIDIYDLLKKCPSLEIPDIQINKIDYGSIPYVPRTPVVKTIEKEQFPLEYLRAQITPDEFEAKSICNSVRRMNSLQKAAEKRKMSAAIRAEKRAEKRAVEAEMKAMVKAVRNAAKAEIKLNTKKKFEGSKKRFSESHRMAQMM